MRDYLKLENHFRETEDIPSECLISGGISNPEVTIAIPTYKRATLLKETIESALRQKPVCEFEIIIVDNNPDREDETELLMLSYSDPRLRYFKNSKNLKLPGNWNRLYTLARGKWVVMVHDDDLLCDNFLEDIYPFLNTDVDIISGVFHPFTSNPKTDTSDTPVIGKIIPFIKLWNTSGLTIAGLTIRRQAMKEIGGFNPKLQNLDCALITQMAYYKKAMLIDKPLAPYRILCNDSMNPKVFENCIIEEYNRQQFILRRTLPKCISELLQINTTLCLTESWNRQFKVNFISPKFANVGKFTRFISKMAGKVYSLILACIYPAETMRFNSIHSNKI